MRPLSHEELNEIYRMALPLIHMLRDKYNPHHSVRIDQSGIEIVETKVFTSCIIEIEPYYFTFGSNHVTENGVSLGNCYVVIEGASEAEARDKMAEARGMKWCTSYPEHLFLDQIIKFNLKELTLDDVTLLPSTGSATQ